MIFNELTNSPSSIDASLITTLLVAPSNPNRITEVTTLYVYPSKLAAILYELVITLDNAATIL